MNSEKDIIKNAQKDIKNFDKLYIEYSKKIKNYIRSKVANDEFIADDLTSQTFEKALKNIKNFKWQGVSFSAWLYTIANNTLIDFYRKQNKPIETKSEIYENISDNKPSLEERIIENDLNSRLRIIIEDLPHREKEVVVLKFYEGFTNKKIAEILGLSETNVGTILYRTVKKLRDLIISNNGIQI